VASLAAAAVAKRLAWDDGQVNFCLKAGMVQHSSSRLTPLVSFQKLQATIRILKIYRRSAAGATIVSRYAYGPFTHAFTVAVCTVGRRGYARGVTRYTRA
jgi:hypothetical protein